ncbi:DUF5680 domain-containing protein [Ruminiclostridium cellulolyticum]|uniref:Transcriptional regulator, XRE family n=1 Tax=Ruminiclostridium cellulolyticum (strain ATCC 35319 / DSM 5812 / JCM 6584 / H10) TaxID=394503 RepID=B8I376_RUMCH|nr:DUF5680 domain-containing protein [Ruminiclostridium cellulolyticum]ACL76219.1 transcriptional regulator, XRE family [Ruminiclostridium cellulolyticum H10]
MNLEHNDVVNFLIKAKKATYAGKGPELLPSRPQSHDLLYEEGHLKYIDTYIGGTAFSGEEAMWYQEIPFWSMNYCGRVIAEGFSGDFLKEALLNIPFEKPFRGPEKYKRDDLLYTSKVHGDFLWFFGMEEIYFHDVKVYECRFHGGSIK